MGILSSLMGNAGAVDIQKLQNHYGQLLFESETIEAGFKVFRDTFIFTNKRLILVDKQGLAGSKTQYLSISYKSISRFSVETAGTFDLDAELKSGFLRNNSPAFAERSTKR